MASAFGGGFIPKNSYPNHPAGVSLTRTCSVLEPLISLCFSVASWSQWSLCSWNWLGLVIKNQPTFGFAADGDMIEGNFLFRVSP